LKTNRIPCSRKFLYIVFAPEKVVLGSFPRNAGWSFLFKKESKWRKMMEKEVPTQ